MPSSPSFSPPAPSLHLRVLATWVAVYPTITIALAVLRTRIGSLPLAAQTLVLTAVVVPIATYGIIPLLLRLVAALSTRSVPGEGPVPGSPHHRPGLRRGRPVGDDRTGRTGSRERHRG
ncbi:hypothetical protein ACFV6E_37740 [Streptomyces sp. NPDC059785]|uniref:hypothetical protein n=1 Tax=Streptomyces sp. NPDC059785 TaxID=3346945 RepID=UPI003653A30D